MSERVLVGDKVFHKIAGCDERGNPEAKCGAHNLLHRIKVIKRHQAVFRDRCCKCYKEELERLEM